MAIVLSLGPRRAGSLKANQVFGQVAEAFEKGFAGGLMDTRTGFPDFT